MENYAWFAIAAATSLAILMIWVWRGRGHGVSGLPLADLTLDLPLGAAPGGLSARDMALPL